MVDEFEEFKPIEKRFNEEETLQDKRYLLDALSKFIRRLGEDLECQEEDEEISCACCGGDCEMNTEYEGSAVCKDPNCNVHKEI